jgi:hypothetical protein
MEMSNIFYIMLSRDKSPWTRAAASHPLENSKMATVLRKGRDFTAAAHASKINDGFPSAVFQDAAFSIRQQFQNFILLR